MGRPKRILFCERVAHVYSHTIPEIIFTDEDREMLFKVVERYTQKNGYLNYFFTILRNHFHGLEQFLQNIDSSKQLQVIKQQMTTAYNERHRRKGTIWWSRYDDVSILGQPQLLRTFVYQCCNQSRAGIVENPFEERFSSTAAYAFGIDDGVTTFLPEYLEFGDTPQERQSAFQQMVTDALDIYKDVDAYARAYKSQGKHRLDPSWSKDLFKLEEHERKHLEKRRDEQTIILVVPKSQDGLTEEAIAQAVQEAQEQEDKTMLSEEDRDELMRKGIPDRVIRLFYGPKDSILKMVRENYKTFRLHVPP